MAGGLPGLVGSTTKWKNTPSALRIVCLFVVVYCNQDQLQLWIGFDVVFPNLAYVPIEVFAEVARPGM